MRISKLVRKYRKDHKLTLAEFGTRAWLFGSSVWAIENNRKTIKSLRLIDRLAVALEMDRMELRKKALADIVDDLSEKFGLSK